MKNGKEGTNINKKEAIPRQGEWLIVEVFWGKRKLFDRKGSYQENAGKIEYVIKNGPRSVELLMAERRKTFFRIYRNMYGHMTGFMITIQSGWL